MTKISYLKETWNFMGGCSPCGMGCLRCWACRQASGRLKNHPLYRGLTKDGKWTGEIRLCTDIGREDLLEKPLHWREPRTIGVQFMGDLFLAPFEFIDKVALAMSLADQHIYLLLTKRPERALACHNRWMNTSKGNNLFRSNVHLCVSISTQKEEDEKIPILLQIPAAHWFVSVEPMLEKIDLQNVQTRIGEISYVRGSVLEDEQCFSPCRAANGNSLDSVIIGAESIGGNAGRPCNLDWVRALVGQCDAAGVPVHIKQLHIDDKLEKDVNKFPPDLRRQEKL